MVCSWSVNVHVCVCVLVYWVTFINLQFLECWTLLDSKISMIGALKDLSFRLVFISDSNVSNNWLLTFLLLLFILLFSHGFFG